MTFQKPCAFENCKTMFECVRGTAKYCPEHKRIMSNIRCQKSHRKRREAQLKKKIGRKCLNCKGGLPLNRTKYCSRKCSDKFDLKVDKRVRKINNVIRHHEEYILILKQKISLVKKGVFENDD